MSRNLISRIAVTVAATTMLVSLGLSVASADHCVGCIDRDDIEENAITSKKILNGTIKPGDLSPATLTYGGQIDLDGTTSSSVAGTLDAFTVFVPADGFLQVTVIGSYWLNLDAAADESLTSNFKLALCTAPDSLSQAACADTNGTNFQDAEDATPSATNETPFFSITRQFKVSKGQERTFYVNGSTGPLATSLSLWTGTRASVQFFRKQLTIAQL